MRIAGSIRLFLLSLLALGLAGLWGGSAHAQFDLFGQQPGSSCQLNTNTSSNGTLLGTQLVPGNSNSDAERLALVRTLTGDPNAVQVACSFSGGGQSGTWTANNNQDVTHILVKASTPQQVFAINNPPQSTGPWSTACIVNNGGQQPDISGVFCYRSGDQPDDEGTITIEKETVGGTAEFGFTLTGPGSTNENFSLDTTNGNPVSSGAFTVPAGDGEDYVATEITIPTNWDLTAISCTNAQGSRNVNVNLAENEVTIPDLQANENVVCKFTNTFEGQKGNIRIEKKANGADESFEYTGTLGQFSIAALDGQTVGQDFNNVEAGITYSITEQLPPDWKFDGVSCTVDGESFDPTINNTTVEFELEANTSVVCTYENSFEGKDGKIIVKKQTKGGNAAFNFQLIDQGNNTDPFQLSNGQMEMFSRPPGSYMIQEVDLPKGWTLDDINCGDAGERDGNKITIALPTGGEVTCVFTNVLREKDSTIKITKLTNPDDITGKFPFKIVNSFREIVASSTIDTSVNNMVKFTVPTETYSVLEMVPEGWQLAEKGCELNGRDVGEQTSNGVSGIKLGFGDELECVFVDRREMGRIVVKKKTIGGNDDFDFILSGTSLSGTSFQLSNGDSREFELVTGSYTIAEDNLPDGWTLKNADCGGVGNQDGDKISVDLNGDESITCTFTNFKEVDDRMEDVVKVFINRRVNNLLDHGPDRARILNRLNQQQSLPSLKDTPPLKYSGTDVSTLTSGTAFGVASGTAALPGIGSSSSVIGQSSSGIGGTASGSLPFGLSGDLSNGIPTGKFAFSLSEMREKAYSKEAAKIANAKSFSGLAFGGNPYGVDYGAIPTTLTPQRQDVWVEGHYSHYNDGTGGINRDGNFGIVYIGTDYSVTDTFLIGALVQFDWTDEDVRDADLTGNVDGWGWMVGPYIGAKLSPNLYFSARAAWGQSSNDINLTDDAAGYRTGSFDTDRWLATAELTGNWYHNGVRITPSAEIAYGTENQDAFRNSLGQRVGSNEATVGQLTFGPEFGFRNVRGDGTVVEPIVSIEGVWTFDDGDLVLSDGTVVGNEELTGRVEAGLLVQRPNGWAYRVTGDYNGIGDGDFESYGVRAWLNIPLN